VTEQPTSIQAIIDADDLPCFALDRELRYTAFNRAHAAVMRELYGAEIRLGGCLSDYQTVDADRENARANAERVLAGEVVVDSAFSGGDGDRRYFDIVHTPLRDAVGAVVGVVVRARDVNKSFQNDRRYGLLFENVADGFAYCRLLHDSDGLPADWVYLAVNPAFERLTGVTDVVGKRVTEVMPTIRTLAPQLFDLYSAVVESGEPVEFEADYRNSGRWLHFRAMRPEADHFVAVLSDVTERHVAELARDSTEAQRAAVLDAMLDPYALLQAVRDESGAIVDFVFADANQAACEFNGLPRDMLIGANLLGRHPAAGATGLFDMYTAVIETGEPLVLDDWSYPQDLMGGEERRYDVRAVRVGDAVSQTWRDVTQRHAAAEALASAKEEYRLLAENASDVVFRGDSDGILRWISPSVTALTGWRPEEIVGQPFAELVHPEDRVTFADARGRVGDGIATRYEIRVRTADGDYRWISVSTRPHQDESGAVIDRVGGWRDVHAEVEARAELAKMTSLRDFAEQVSQTGSWSWNLKSGRVTWSAGMYRLHDLEADEFIGDYDGVMEGRIHPEDREAARKAFERYRRSGGPFEYDYRVVWRDGSVHDIHSVGLDEPGAAGAVLTGLSTDVTERKVADQARLAVEARRLAILDTMLDPHALLQAVRDESGAIVDFTYLDANRTACEYLGLECEQLIGSTVLELMPGHAGTGLLAIYAEAVENSRPIVLDDYAYPHELLKSERRYDIRGVTIGDMLSITWRDVTERHAAAAALADSEARLRAIVEGASEGINVLDLRTGRYTFMSPAQVALTGFTAAEMNDLPAEDAWERLHPDDRETSINQQKELAEGRDEFSATEYRWRVKSGEYRWFRDSRRVLTDTDGERYAIVGVSSDITEQVEAEQEIKRLNEELARRVAMTTEQRDALNRELESFAYSIAHDVRTPLRAIHGFSSVVINDERSNLSEQGQKDLDRVRQATTRLAWLLDDLMDLSHVARRDLLLRPVDVSALAREVGDELAADQPSRVVELDVQPDMSAEGDPVMLRLILRELLDNAWKFTARRATAHVAVGKREDGGEPVFFARDDGVGFDTRHAGHLFGAFQRMHPSDQFPGHGIGLATAQRLVARHGGRIWAEAEVDKGATFFFTLRARTISD
jgi:PAS domain S-box-containing protein